jgi:hypothetical protein
MHAFGILSGLVEVAPPAHASALTLLLDQAQAPH